jgi:hypothetical protein
MLKVLDIYVYFRKIPKDLAKTQKRNGKRMVLIKGHPDYSRIIEDILRTRTGNIAVAGRDI